MKILKLFHNITYFNCKTLYFNFIYFAFHKAIKIPVLVSRNTKLKKMKGSIVLEGEVRSGMIKLGAEEVGIFDKKYNRTTWENLGKIVFKGDAIIKYGAKIIVGERGILTLGNGFRISADAVVICYHKITFGENCRISWQTQIMDTDFHRIYNDKGQFINPDKEIIIGNNCWIGNRCTITKGSEICNKIVVASNSLVNKKFSDSNAILAGIPAKTIKKGITWVG